MEHPGAKRLLTGDDNIAIIIPSAYKRCHEDVRRLINEMGKLSSEIQGLKHIITTYQSFMDGDNTIYMLVSEDKRSALGFVKVGMRHLFFWDSSGNQKEFNILCLLDFFVHPSTQRKGYGKVLIDKMLADKGLEMSQIPIDKPSPLCLSFMKKHFNFVDFIPQSNHYVVFSQFWEKEEEQSKKKQDPYPGKYGLPLLKNKSNTQRIITPSVLAQQIKNNAANAVLSKQPSAINKASKLKHKKLNPITWMPY